MANKMYKKNFKYGDIYSSEQDLMYSAKPSTLLSREELDDYELGNDYINFIDNNGFTVVLAYSPNEIEIAHTNLQTKVVTINGNYPVEVISSLIRHELGHFMIFATDEPYSKAEYSVRSLLIKEIYSRINLKRYPLSFLANIENVVQDVLIETINHPLCVCEVFNQYGLEKEGVKHIDSMEYIPKVVKEAVANCLAKDKEDRQYVSNEMTKSLREFLEESLNKSIKSIEDSLEEDQLNQASSEFKERITKSMERKKAKLQEKLDKMNKLDGTRRQVSDEMKDKVKEDIQKLEEQLETGNLNDRTREFKDNEKVKGKKQIDKLNKIKDELTNNENQFKDLEEEENEEGTGHSCSTYLPNPNSIVINEKIEPLSYTKLRNHLLKLKQLQAVSKLSGGIPSDKNGTIISNLKEETYSRTSKLEYDNSDMLMGKKRRRNAGVSILVGIDVSGSMTKVWVNKFKETIKYIRAIARSMQLKEPVMFTYGDHLGTISNEDNEIEKAIKAGSGGGGNAFGKVYEQLMAKAPISSYTEIILVTDCGDNLGWDIQTPLSKLSQPVEVHCSVLDTDGYVAKNDHESWIKEMWSYYDTNNIPLHLICKAIEKDIQTKK